MAGKGTFNKRPLTERCDCNTQIDVSGDVTVLLSCRRKSGQNRGALRKGTLTLGYVCCLRTLHRAEGHSNRNSMELRDEELDSRSASLEVAATGYRRR